MTLGLSRDDGGKTKVLGIHWNTDKDISDFDVGKFGNMPNTVVTKRGILSTLVRIFDPLGLISPIAVSANVLFQELCLERLSWDDPLPADKVRRWEVWLNDLKVTDTSSLPRCIIEGMENDTKIVTLHGFGVSSKHAYCAMIYLVIETSGGHYTK